MSQLKFWMDDRLLNMISNCIKKCSHTEKKVEKFTGSKNYTQCYRLQN